MVHAIREQRENGVTERDEIPGEWVKRKVRIQIQLGVEKPGWGVKTRFLRSRVICRIIDCCIIDVSTIYAPYETLDLAVPCVRHDFIALGDDLRHALLGAHLL